MAIQRSSGVTMVNNGKAQAQGGSKTSEYGFWVVVIAIVAVLVAFLVSLTRLTVDGDVSTAASAMFAAVGTLAGAYFGFHAGSSGKRNAENERQQEALKSQKLAALAHESSGYPDQVDKILGL